MTTYGVTPEGFAVKSLATEASEIDAGLQGILGASAGTEPDGTLPTAGMAGQLKALLVDGFSAHWDLLQSVAASLDPNQTTDAAQDAVCALTGTLREAARFSTVTETCVGTPLTLLPAGRVMVVESTGSRFVSQADGTIAAATGWNNHTLYAVGDFITNASNVYVCITAGESAGGGSGPTTTSLDITDNTVHWQWVGGGTGIVNITFQAETAGALGALSGTLNQINTPVSGWTGGYNVLDAAVGRTIESNTALRVRREQELAAAGNTTRDAIRANILSVNEGSTDPSHVPPIACEVFINDTDFTDSDGMPPHSIEVLVQDGTDADIAQAVFDSVGAGTATYGNTTSSVVDSEGITQTVRWTRPVEVPIYGAVTAYFDQTAWTPGSELVVAQAVLSALLTFTEGYPIARDARTSPLNAAMMRGPSATDDAGVAIVPAPEESSPVPGLLEVDPIHISTAPGPIVSTTIAISRRQIATFSSSNWTVTAFAETP